MALINKPTFIALSLSLAMEPRTNSALHPRQTWLSRPTNDLQNGQIQHSSCSSSSAGNCLGGPSTSSSVSCSASCFQLSNRCNEYRLGSTQSSGRRSDTAGYHFLLSFALAVSSTHQTGGRHKLRLYVGADADPRCFLGIEIGASRYLSAIWRGASVPSSFLYRLFEMA
ncbi:hypothetical protein PMI36_03117 [Pseudomonas sp. GM79]|nr:hypothetical protein PMI36_03117 [Pseudomonas sp. GM79]